MLFVASFVFLVPAVPLAISIVVSPEAIERGDVQLSPPCPTLLATGEECPTCGMTRGFTAMSRLRVGDAIAYNAGAPWLYLLCWIVLLASGSLLARLGAEIVRRQRRPSTSQLSPSS